MGYGFSQQPAGVRRIQIYILIMSYNIVTLCCCSDEIQRNRNKVMEINYFLDKQREAFDRIQEEVENENDD